LVSLSAGHNASSGVPAVVSVEVWEDLKLEEGCIVEGVVQWQPMSIYWAGNFTWTKGVPRGYLLLTKRGEVRVRDRGAPTQFHPYTVMEYSEGSARLYDFVYVTTDTKQKNYRHNIEKFFKRYRKANGRDGRYLLCTDVSDPLWESDFMSPEQLRGATPSAKAHLDLLTQRIRKNTYKGKTLKSIVGFVASHYDTEQLKTLAAHSQIDARKCFTGGAAADRAAELVSEALQTKRIEGMLDQVLRQYPDFATE
jgi:hypothetical protein